MRYPSDRKQKFLRTSLILKLVQLSERERLCFGRLFFPVPIIADISAMLYDKTSYEYDTL